METLLTDALLASTAFAALIGGPDEPELAWEVPPDAALPKQVRLHEIPVFDPMPHLGGRDGVETEWWVQIDCWATSKAEASAMRAVLMASDGPLAALTGPPLLAGDRRRHGRGETVQGPAPDRTTTLFRASLDVQLWLFATG